MDFKLFSTKYKEIESSYSGSFNIKDNGNKDFLHQLKSEELKTKKKYFRMYVIYTIGAIVYFALFILNPDPELTPYKRFMGTSFVIAFIILLILFKKVHTEINRTFFLKSPKEFLMEVRKRYVFWNKKQFWLIPALLLVNIGATLSISRYLEDINLFTGIIMFQILFWILMTFGFFMGKRDWVKNKKPVLQKIEKMLSEFEV